jgi:hypothetical protein
MVVPKLDNSLSNDDSYTKSECDVAAISLHSELLHAIEARDDKKFEQVLSQARKV